MTALGPEELLRRRARDLARPLATAEDAAATREVMRFRLGDEGYAVPLDTIRQVVPLTGAARLPREAWPLVALARVGGTIVPVVSLDRSSARAGLPAGTPWAVAVGVRGTVMCLPADEVTGLVALRDAEVTDAVDGERERERERYARGLTREGDVLVDVDALMASVEGQPVDGRSGTAGPGDDLRDQG